MYRRFLFSKWIQIKLEQQSTDVFTIDMTKRMYLYSFNAKNSCIC
jgi:hypothetical protein